MWAQAHKILVNNGKLFTPAFAKYKLNCILITAHTCNDIALKTVAKDPPLLCLLL